MSVRGQLAYSLYQWFWTGLDWLYPPRCGGCDQNGSRWCVNCQRETNLMLPPICLICGRSISRVGLCHACSASPPAFTALRSWGAFSGPLQSALHRLKYRRSIALGEALSRHLVACLVGQGWRVDLVVPVPLGVARQAERGYNQAALLAKPLALACHLQYHPRALHKVVETRSQVGLTHDERWNNVENSFAAARPVVDGKRVLVVDDVATSGATLNACAVALRAAGAADVYALTLARA